MHFTNAYQSTIVVSYANDSIITISYMLKVFPIVGQVFVLIQYYQNTILIHMHGDISTFL
jgi:hypothetical protein